jgi:xylulokinase
MFIGIDTSTTATKAILIDEKGQVLSVAANEYSFETPHPLWSEQSPHLWWNATIQSIREVLANVDAKKVRGIGLTRQMHGLVLLDEKGDVLRPASCGTTSAPPPNVMRSARRSDEKK